MVLHPHLASEYIFRYRLLIHVLNTQAYQIDNDALLSVICYANHVFAKVTFGVAPQSLDWIKFT